MEASDGEPMYGRLEGRVKPTVVEQNELEDNGIIEGSVERDVI